MLIEIHITTKALRPEEIDGFVSFCKTIDAKPIIIELPEGETQQHPMISKRIEAHDRAALDSILSYLKSTFIEAGYPLSRVKLEVYSKHAEEGKSFFPEFKGGYFEWHGKVFHDDLDKVYELAKKEGVHVSKNGLKGIPNRRIITIRETKNEGIFENKISSAKRTLNQYGIEVANEEYEYCIYDSNKALDHGWLNTPEITDQAHLDLLAFEAFLRRAAKLDLPFILKGSMLTRQFYPNKEDRIARDLDYLYFGEVKDDLEFMTEELSNWTEQVTTTSLDDGVKFRPFSENKFWRAIDYAMNDDFPTTNTDLTCVVHGTENPDISLDVSWGLPINVPPAPFMYEPLEGEPFEIPFTTPISLQISWKLHQCIVRPRLKDFLDLIHMLESIKVTEHELEIAVEEFLKECQKDFVEAGKLFHFMNGAVRNSLAPAPPKGFFTSLIHSRIPKSPIIHLGELLYNDIAHLKYSFPNYASKYDTVTDILFAFENVMKANNVDGILREKLGG
ncbi:MAG: nucleotidyl transferase AbiEii/AbiGii toxin family protein [Bacteroidia bacterium]